MKKAHDGKHRPNIFQGHKRQALLLFFCLLLFACRQEIARVGEIPITENDLSLRAKVSEIYYPGSGKRHVALAQLLKGYLSFQVLKSMDQPADEAILKKEARRIDETTQAPEVLRKIKEVYGRDTRSYQDTFIRVVYAERVLYNDIFLKSEEIHKEQRAKAESILQEVLRSPHKFVIIAKGKGDVVKLRLSPSKGIQREGGKQGRAESPTEANLDQAKRLIEALSQVKPGGVCPRVIDWLEGYQVIRFLGKEKNVYLIESVGIPKRDYEGWFWEKAIQIPVKIRDRSLKEELIKEVSWARHINMD